MLNPNELFVILMMARSDIANMCNDRLQVIDHSIEPFTADDARLTSPMCSDLAGQFTDMYDLDLSEEERGDDERDIIDAFLRKHFLGGN